MPNYLSQSSRERNPTKGLRQKLRTALREGGVMVKFSTEIHRDGRLLVISKTPITLPFDEFEGRKVVTGLRN